MSQIKIRNKDVKLKSSLLKNKNLIIEQLKEEWKEAEKALAGEKRKKYLIKLAKEVNIAIGKGLLTLLLVGGTLTVVAVAPNVFIAYGSLMRQRRYFDKKQFNKNKYYFKRHGLIEIKKRGQDNFEITLTEKGVHKSLEEGFKNLKIKSPQKDGYWRIVIFDIPNKYNWARDAFRQKLGEMEFHQLQKSVFIIPYPCEREVEFLASVLNISSFVYLIKTKDFSGNKELEEIFK